MSNIKFDRISCQGTPHVTYLRSLSNGDMRCHRLYVFGSLLVFAANHFFKPDVEVVICCVGFNFLECNGILPLFRCKGLHLVLAPYRHRLTLPVTYIKINHHFILIDVAPHLFRRGNIIIYIRRERDKYLFGVLAVKGCVVCTNQQGMFCTVVGKTGQFDCYGIGRAIRNSLRVFFDIIPEEL